MKQTRRRPARDLSGDHLDAGDDAVIVRGGGETRVPSPFPGQLELKPARADPSRRRERSSTERRSSLTGPVNPAVRARTSARPRACSGDHAGQWHNGLRFHGCPAFSCPRMAAFPPPDPRPSSLGVDRAPRGGRAGRLRMDVARVGASRATVTGSADRRVASGRVRDSARPARDSAAEDERFSPRAPGGAPSAGPSAAPPPRRRRRLWPRRLSPRHPRRRRRPRLRRRLRLRRLRRRRRHPRRQWLRARPSPRRPRPAPAAPPAPTTPPAPAAPEAAPPCGRPPAGARARRGSDRALRAVPRPPSRRQRRGRGPANASRC